MAGKYVEIPVVVQNRDSSANGNRGDEAVHQLADSFALPSTAAVQGSSGIVVSGLHWYDRSLIQRPADGCQLQIASCSRKYLNPYSVADGNIFRP